MLRGSGTAKNIALFIGVFFPALRKQKDEQSSPIVLIITFKHIIRCLQTVTSHSTHGDFFPLHLNM